MISLQNIGSNQRVLVIQDSEKLFGDKQKFLFSYETMVAAIIETTNNQFKYKIGHFYSKSTSRHINQFGCGVAELCDPEFLENLLRDALS
jgi:hypothetical protein